MMSHKHGGATDFATELWNRVLQSIVWL